MIAGEVEDYKAQLEQLERTYKMQANELSETSDRVNELSAQNSSLNAQKKRLETTVQQMQGDLDSQVIQIQFIPLTRTWKEFPNVRDKHQVNLPNLNRKHTNGISDMFRVIMTRTNYLSRVNRDPLYIKCSLVNAIVSGNFEANVITRKVDFANWHSSVHS